MLCPTCNGDYAQVHDHIRKNHPEQSYSIAELEPIGLVPCPDCGFACKGPQGIKVHQRKIHNIVGKTALTQPTGSNQPNSSNRPQPSGPTDDEVAEIRRQNRSRARAITLGRASPETYERIARFDRDWEAAKSQASRARSSSRITTELAIMPTLSRFQPQLTANIEPYEYNTLGSRKRRAHSPLASQPQPSRPRAASTSSVESLESLEAIVRKASQKYPNSAARQRSDSIASLLDSPRGDLRQSQWASAPTPAQRPEPTQLSEPSQLARPSQPAQLAPQPQQAQQLEPIELVEPSDLESLRTAHNYALREAKEDAHLQQLIQYAKVPMPEKRLHGRHAVAFAKTANRLAQAYINRPSDTTILHFLLLPRILAIAMTKGNINRTLEHYPHVIPEIPAQFSQRSQSSPAEAPQQPSQPDRAKRAQKLLESGLIGRAAKALTSEATVAANTPANLAALYRKHPIGSSQPFPPGNPRPGPPVPQSTIAEAIRTTHRETSPGLSGWTKPLLERAATPNSAVLAMLHQLTNAILKGTAHGRLLLTASHLVSLSKKDGGIRPIAVGDLIYRIAAKSILQTHFRSNMLGPNQLGVNNPGGTEPAIFMLEEAIMGPNINGFEQVTSIDAENAFNAQQRILMASAIYQHAPIFFRAAKWAYNHASALVTAEGHILASAEGIRQGDPFGPFFFSLSLRNPLERIQQELPDSQIVAYLDDIYGLEKSLRPELLDVAERILKEGGLRINRAKSSQKAISAVRREGMEVLGTFIGPRRLRAEFLGRKATILAESLQLLSGIPKQHALLLLRGSLSHQLRHLLRQLNPEGLEPIWEAIDESVRVQVGQLASRDRQIEPIAEPTADMLTSIPIRAGGLGLLAHAAIATDIYIATKASTPGLAHLSPTLSREAEPPDDPPRTAISPREVLQQHQTKAIEQLKQQLTADEANIYIENTSYLSRQWLTTLPTLKQLVLTDIEITEAIRSRLLLPIRPTDTPCNQCGLRFTIGHEDACRQMDKRWTARHDQINRAITKTLSCRPDLEVMLEPKPTNPSEAQVRPDFSVLMAASRYYYDTQVVALNKASNKAQPAETLAEAATAKRTKHNRTQFFHPMIFSSGGLMEQATATIYRQIQKLVGPAESSWMDSQIGLALTRARCHAAHSFQLARTNRV